jgi:hypothetical protein
MDGNTPTTPLGNYDLFPSLISFRAIHKPPIAVRITPTAVSKSVRTIAGKVKAQYPGTTIRPRKRTESAPIKYFFTISPPFFFGFLRSEALF